MCFEDLKISAAIASSCKSVCKTGSVCEPQSLKKKEAVGQFLLTIMNRTVQHRIVL